MISTIYLMISNQHYHQLRDIKISKVVVYLKIHIKLKTKLIWLQDQFKYLINTRLHLKYHLRKTLVLRYLAKLNHS